MTPVPVEYFLLLGTGLFTIGVVGVLTRRNIIIILMSIELILNAVNINLVAFSHLYGNVNGQVFALFVITDAVAQAHRSEEHTSELQSRLHLVCRLLLEKKKNRE